MVDFRWFSSYNSTDGIHPLFIIIGEISLKFKIIFILFNFVIILSFLAVILMPTILLGPNFAFNFWTQWWYISLIFILAIAGLNIFYMYNWRLFSLLETENWSDLLDYLRTRIFEKKRFNGNNIRLFINAALVTMRFDELSALREYIQKEKAALLKKYGVEIGMDLVINQDIEQMKDFYANLIELMDGRNKNLFWTRWLYAFATYLAQEAETAVLKENLEDPKCSLLLRVLSAYLLAASMDPDDRQRALEERKKLMSLLNKSKWEAIVAKAKNGVQGLLLTKVVVEAGNWLFSE
jgi:hypothetical protein